MNKTNYEKLVKSFERLKEQYANYTNKKNRSTLDEEGVKESVIKRFEICHDTLWKHLKKYLQGKEKLTDIPNSPNGVFRKAYETKLIDEEILSRLMDYNNLRIMTAHDYNEAKAQKSLNQIGGFIQDTDKICKIITSIEEK